MARSKSPLLLYASARSWWAMAESFALSPRPWMMRVQAAMLRSGSSPLQASQSARLAAAAGAAPVPAHYNAIAQECCWALQQPLQPGNTGQDSRAQQTQEPRSAPHARAAMSTFMTRLHIWTVAVFGISASADRLAPAGPKMPTLVLPTRDRDHKLRTIQNDSDCPASGRNVSCARTPTPWRGLGLACFIELSLDGQHDSRDELCRSIVILGRESCGRAAHQTATRLHDVERLSCGRGRASAL